MIRVVVVDDHPIVRRGLRETLQAEPDIRVVGEAERSEEVLGVMAGERCDVLLLDVSLPGRGGLDVLKDVRREFPRVLVLMVSTHDELHYAVRSLRAGAAGYLTKTSAPEELVTAVRSVMRSGRYITEAVAGLLADHTAGGFEQAPHERLSDREHEVLRLVASGRSVSDIANDLSLSVKTVSTYRTRLLEKLGARTTADLVRYALERRLLE